MNTFWGRYILVFVMTGFACNSEPANNTTSEMLERSDSQPQIVSEPIWYSDFVSTNKNGDKFNVSVVGIIDSPSGRRISFSPSQKIENINLRFLVEDAISRSKDGRLNRGKKEGVIPNEADCWVTKQEKIEVCAVQNPLLEDGTVAVVHLWVR